VIVVAAELVGGACEVDDGLVRSGVLHRRAELGRTVSEDERFGERHHFVHSRNHQTGDVRNHVEDVVAVRAGQRSHVHVSVVESEVVALPDQPLNDIDEWRLS